ncbi:MAG: hypothetical protein AAFR91_03755 [Pseudomonadota bacterium]
MNLAIFILALAASLIAGYAIRIMSRDSAGLVLTQHESMWRQIVGALAFPAMLALIVWGFLELPWWFVVVAFIGLSIVAVPAVFGRDPMQRLPLIYNKAPVFNVVTIVAAGFLWWQRVAT